MFRRYASVFVLLCTSVSLIAQASVFDTLPADTKVRLFAMHGSNTIGEELAPNLLQRWFLDAGLSQVRIEPTGVENERLVSGRHDRLRTRVEVLVAAHGSGTGYRSLLDGSGDIAASSRPIKDKEYDMLKLIADMRSFATEHVVAIDGLAVIVHPDNPITELSVEQIAAVFPVRFRTGPNWEASVAPFSYTPGMINLVPGTVLKAWCWMICHWPPMRYGMNPPPNYPMRLRLSRAPLGLLVYRRCVLPKPLQCMTVRHGRCCRTN